MSLTYQVVCRAALGFYLWVGCTDLLSAQVQVGLAQTDITPPVGGLTAGYSSAKPTEAVHDPLSARVLILKSDNANVVLVSCDLCVYNDLELHQQVKQLGFDQLLFHNTHTHAGPKMDQDYPSPEKPWSLTLRERILRAIEEAQANLFVAKFAAAETFIPLGYNRLVRRGDFAHTYFENPERIPYGKVDEQVSVIRITDEEDQVRAVLVNYACHPVVLGPRNRQLSADFPGVTRRIVERALEGEAMCIFLQGAAGDINPLFLARDEQRDTDFEVVERMGDALATEVLRALQFIENVPGTSQSFVARSSTTQVEHRFEPEETLELGITSLLINDEIGILTLPGEPFHKFAKDARELSNLKHVVLIGYTCNAAYPWPAYIPDLVSAAHGGYGASENTRAAVGAGEQLLNQGVVQLFELQGRLKDEPMRNTFPNPDP